MLNILEVTETNQMIEKENLDVRTITLGISLLDHIIVSDDAFYSFSDERSYKA